MAAKRTRSAESDPTAAVATITAIKGFHSDWTCRPNGVVYQYELGKPVEVA